MAKEASSSQNSNQEMAVTANQAQQEEHNMKQEMKNETTVITINVNQMITPGYHPRTSEVDVKTLAASIKNEGLLSGPHCQDRIFEK